jgi:hypothetical protein
MKQFIVCLAGASLLITSQSFAVEGIYLYQEPCGAADSYPTAVADWQYVGIRFQVDQPVEITSLHTEMGDSPSSFFAALVPLPTVTSLPQGNPFGSGEVIHSTVFDLTWDYPVPRDIPFNVTINPGTYAIIFGGGLFGSSGYISGAISAYQAVPGSSGFVWVPDSPPGLGPWHDTTSTWAVAIQGVPIPEPGLIGVVVCGCLILGAGRRWLRKGDAGCSFLIVLESVVA